jgi:hypothetical protein
MFDLYQKGALADLARPLFDIKIIVMMYLIYTDSLLIAVNLIMQIMPQTTLMAARAQTAVTALKSVERPNERPLNAWTA